MRRDLKTTRPKKPENGFPALSLYKDPESTTKPSIHVYEEAQQIWLILVAVAMAPRFSNRTPPRITYGELADFLQKPGAGRTLNGQLFLIHKICEHNGMPQLNSIVVSAESEEPGQGIPNSDPDDIFLQQKNVMQENWFNVRIPSIGEFRTIADEY